MIVYSLIFSKAILYQLCSCNGNGLLSVMSVTMSFIMINCKLFVIQNCSERSQLCIMNDIVNGKNGFTRLNIKHNGR